MNNFRRWCLWVFLLSNPFGWIVLAVAIVRARREYLDSPKATAEYMREFRKFYGTDCLREKPENEDDVFVRVPDRGDRCD